MTVDTATRLLTAHFFRRFIDNDLVSPEGDGHENVAILFAFLIVVGMFVSMGLVLSYINPYVSPSQRLLVALDDKFLGLGCSMILVALATVLQWDALALDDRDRAILGPLPIEYRTLIAAKLAALGLFVVTLTAALNGVPSVIYPALLVGAIRVSVVKGLLLVLVHALTCTAATTFAFLSMVAVRELLRWLLGSRAFPRMSLLTQFVLVVGLIASLLVLPALASNVSARLATRTRVYASPPMWFIGLYETLTAAVGAVPEAAGGPGPRALWTPASDAEAKRRYVAHQPLFRDLAGLAVGALAVVTIVGLGAYLVNSTARATQGPALPRRRRGRVRRATFRLLAGAFLRHPAARAGFSFTLQALSRSGRPRLYAAGGLAVGAVVAFVFMGSPSDAGIARASGATTPRLLAIQMVLPFFVIAALRAAFAVPVALRANWVFQSCWSGELRQYLTGVRRAIGFVIVPPILGALVPFHVMLWGPAVAVEHLAFGWLASLVLVDVSLIGFRKLPFTCGYTPKGTLKFLWPLYLLAFFSCTLGFAALEGQAFQSDWGELALLGGLVALLAGGALCRWAPRRERSIAFDDPQDPAVVRFPLSEST
jgi:hypothetical protein